MIERGRAGWRPVRSVLLRFLGLLFIGLALARPVPLAAQTRADSAAVLLEAARRFEIQGRGSVADALYTMILEQFGDSPAAAEVRRIRATMPAGRLERGGSVELQVWSSLYGLWLGVALPMIAGAESAEPYGLGLLGGGPVGFLVGRGYARSRSLSEGQARAITWGGTWGTWQGLGWAHVLDFGTRTERICGDPAFPCSDVEVGDNAEEVTAAMVGVGLAGIAAGVLLSRKPIPSGLATTVNFGSLWGSWFGLATSIVADFEGDDVLAGTLVGGNVGLVTTAVLGPGWQLSRNRARLISIAGVVGGLGGAGIDLLIQPENERVALLVPLLTSAAGLAIGAATTRGYDAAGNTPREDGDGSALLRLDRGRWQLDLPAPMPTMLRTERARRPVWQPALGLTLLHARF